jgi:tRNA (guanine37-N1)-methyltransferase
VPNHDSGKSINLFTHLPFCDEVQKLDELLRTPPDLTDNGPDAPVERPATGAIHFDIFTLFPQMFAGPFGESIIQRAQDHHLISIALHNIRDYTTDRHHVCDDTPYGGGGGMIMKPEPIFRAVETVLAHPPGWSLPAADAYVNQPAWDAETKAPLPPHTSIILLSPQGRLLNQRVVLELSQYRRLALICGRYEGVDERVARQLVTDEISIGDYVLSGGELAAMVLVDVLTRLVPGALGDQLGSHQDSHSPGLGGLLEGPHYTRPLVFRGDAAPEILLSGHHANVHRWRREQALLRTLQRRPDLLLTAELSDRDRAFLQQQGWAQNNG